jgi:quercetin dioxygenase-like cupin family protein
MKIIRLGFVAAGVMCSVAAAGCGGGPSQRANTPPPLQGTEQVGPGAKRTIITRKSLFDIPGREAVLSVAEYAPGAASGTHTHAGPEVIYVTAGSITIERADHPPKKLDAGETFLNQANAVHNVKNESKTETATIMSFLVNEEGKDLATPVK